MTISARSTSAWTGEFWCSHCLRFLTFGADDIQVVMNWREREQRWEVLYQLPHLNANQELCDLAALGFFEHEKDTLRAERYLPAFVMSHLVTKFHPGGKIRATGNIREWVAGLREAAVA